MDIGHRVADLAVYLCQSGASEAVCTSTQVNQQQSSTRLDLQLGGYSQSYINHGRKGRDDQ